ncbi:MAG TPA: AMP-binding protein [Fibrobacteria bacterium]|nr:AMP-binding protein [Fibrobacteria bacterium]
MSPSPLVERFLEQVEARGIQEAVVQADRSTTYRDLHRRMLECAGLLRSRGVRPGDRVLLYVPPSADLYALLLAVWRLGAVAVFVDAWTSRASLGRVVDLARPRLFVGIPKAHLVRLLNPSSLRVPSLLWWAHRGGKPDTRPPADVDSRQTALVTFTTGSTGAPKGANRSHDFLLAQHQALSRALGTMPGSRSLATLPIFALHDLASGATCQLASLDPARPDAIDPSRFFSELRECDTAVGSPAVFLSAARQLGAPDPSVRAHIHIGGAAIFPETLRELSEAFPAARWTATYGSTEAEPISTLDGRILAVSHPSPEEGISAGTIDPSLQLKILSASDAPLAAASDSDLSALEVPPGEVGEIVVAGRHVLEGYWNDPAATERHKIRTAERTWHRTGDAGRIAPDGTLHLLGRLAERFQWEGRTYHPFAIQQALLRIDGVLAGCALEHGGRILVVVEPAKGADTGAIRRKIPATKFGFPFEVHFLRIPRDPRHRSKLDTRALRRKLDRKFPCRQEAVQVS